METKSRYQVVAELEETKRKLIAERESFPDVIKNKKRLIKMSERQLEDMKEDLAELEKTIEDRKAVIIEQIASIEDSLKRFDK